MMNTTQHQVKNHTAGVRRATAGALFVMALAVAGCGAPQAAAAPAAEAPAAAVPAAPAIAMADAPQKVAPQAYMSDFVESGAAHQLIDVRTPEEYATGHIAGSINIPVQEIGSRLNEISQDEPVVLYCRSGNRSNQAAQILDGAGFTGVYDLGGIQSWQTAGYPLQ
jgi:rhodanese-related sulfurtransferase